MEQGDVTKSFTAAERQAAAGEAFSSMVGHLKCQVVILALPISCMHSGCCADGATLGVLPALSGLVQGRLLSHSSAGTRAISAGLRQHLKHQCSSILRAESAGGKQLQDILLPKAHHAKVQVGHGGSGLAP